MLAVVLALLVGAGIAAARLAPSAAASSTACQDTTINCINQGLVDYVGTLAPGTGSSAVPGFDAGTVLSSSAPLTQGAADAKAIEQAFTALVPKIQQDLNTAAGNSSTLTAYDTALDKLGGSGTYSSGDFTLAITGSISPHDSTGPYTITLSLTGTLALHDLLTLNTPQLTIAPPSGANSPMSGTLSLTLTPQFNFAPGGVFSLAPGSIGTLSMSAQADYGATSGSVGGDTNPLPFAIGPLAVSATGTVQVGSSVSVSAVDPGADGKITEDEMQSDGGGIYAFACGSGTAALNLSIASTLSGLSGQTSSVSASTGNVCNGDLGSSLTLSPSAMYDFQNITPTDLVDDLGLLTATLRTTGHDGDLKLPFLDTSLSQLAQGGDVAAPLIKFFTDNGLSDASLQTITFDPSKDPDLATIQPLAGSAGLVAKLAQSLGISASALNARYSGGALLFDVNVSEPAASDSLGTLDFGSQLSGAGLTALKGDASASATVKPSWKLKLTTGIDLSPGLSLDRRAFVQTGAPQFTADAPVTAHLSLTGSAGPVAVALTPQSGCTNLLVRADSTKPMLSVALQGSGGRLTVHDFNQASSPPVQATINARVPMCTLTANAQLDSQTIGSGHVTFKWPDITNAFSASADTNYLHAVLPFAYDGDPTALLKSILSAAQKGLGNLASLVRSNSTFATSLPLIGGSIRDLAPQFQNLSDMFDSLTGSDSSTTLGGLESAIQSAVANLFGITTGEAAKMLKLRFLPATSATSPAAIVLDLNLGVCTTDRVTSACVVQEPKPKKAFTLRLGPSSSATVSVVGVGASGQLGASYDVSATLHLGLQLPSVTVGTTQPIISGSATPRPFVLDTSAGTVGVGATLTNGALTANFGGFSGSVGTSSDPASGCLALRLNLDDPSATGKRLFLDGSASAFRTWLTNLVQSPLHDSSFPCSDGNDASAQLPLYANGSKLGTAAFTAPDILDPSGWTFDDGGILQNLSSGNLNFSLFLAGLKQLTALVQSELVDLQGKHIPLIGDHVGAAAQVVSDLQDDVITPLQSAVNSFNSQTSAGALRAKLSSYLWSKVGDPGAGLILPTRVSVASATASAKTATFTTATPHGLSASESITVSGMTPDDYNGSLTVKSVTSPTKFTAVLNTAPSGPATQTGTISAPRVLVDILCNGSSGGLSECDDAAPVQDIQRAEVTVALGQQQAATSQPFNIGFDGLRLTSSGDMQASATWSLDLTFGIDRTQGFFVSSDNHVDPGAPEIAVSGNADLGGGSITGDIAFIPVTLKDEHDGPDAAVQAGLDLQGGTLDAQTGDHLITVDQLTNFESPSGWSLKPSFEACANVKVGLATTKDSGDASSLPELTADLGMEGGIHCSDSGGLGTGGSGDSFSIHFDNVALDLGSWISGFLKPAVDELHKILKPIEPMVDVIKSPVPGISDASVLAGHGPVTWYDVLKLQNGGDDLALLGNVITLVNIDESLSGLSSGNVAIPVGSFDVDVSQAGVVPADPSCTSGFLTSCDAPGGSVISQILGSGAVSHAIKSVVQNSENSGFSFPAFQDPKQLFGLLLGQNPTLVQYDAGPLDATASLNFQFPLGPFTLGIGGDVGAKGHVVAGYDTQGIRDALQAIENGQTVAAGSSLLNGFYIDGNDATGQDVPELALNADVNASAGFGVTLKGSIYAQLQADLKTPQDGRLRFPQIQQELDQAHGNPLCLFDAVAPDGTPLTKGNVGAKLEADLPFGAGSWTIADATIYQLPDVLSFCTPHQQTDTSHGTVHSDGTLEISPSGGGTTGDDDQITLAKSGASQVTVTEASGASESTTTFDGVSQVFVDGGAGDDQISIQSGGPTPEWDFPTVMCGGAGDDMLTGGPGADRIYGDAGGVMTSDVNLICSSGAGDGGGSDTLIGQGGNDQLFGGSGNDTLIGDAAPGSPRDGIAGSDRLDGGSGDDTLIVGSRGGRMIGGQGSDTADFSSFTQALEINLLLPNTQRPDQDAVTASGRLIATLSDVENAVGGSGNDSLIGDGGSNRLEGGAGDDTIVGDGGASANESGDFLSGGDGNDTITGSGAGDTILGGDGNDTITDGLGNDTIDGGNGSDTYLQGPDSSTAPGTGNGADTIADSGGSGTDVVDYTQRPSGSISHLMPAAAQDGYANDGQPLEHDNIQSGIEQIDGPS